MASQSQAYDFSRYEQTQQQPKVRVIKRAQPVKSVYGVRPITLVMVAMMVVTITALLLYNNAMIAEVSARIAPTTSELELLKSENVRLNRELDAKMSNDAIAETAMNELGLNQLEIYQVSYINLTSEDVVTAKEKEMADPVEMIGQMLAAVLEYFRF